MKAYRVVINGEVQGVGFRYFTRMAANRTGVNGWVKNCPDGSVEIHGEGNEESLEKFLADVRKGPSGIVVNSFVVEEVPADFYFGFEIR